MKKIAAKSGKDWQCLPVLFVVIVVFALICFASLQFAYPDDLSEGYPDESVVSAMNEGWRCVSGEETLWSTLPVKLDVSKNEVCTISHVLPEELTVDDALCFRSYNQSVMVKVDGETIYRYDIASQLPLGEHTPSAWHFVSLDGDAAGKVVEISMVSPLRYESGYFSEVWFGTRSDLLAKTTNDHMVEYVISLALLMVGILLVLFALYLRHGDYDHKNILYLGIFVIPASLWLRVKSHVPEIFWLNYAAEHWLASAALMIMPLAYILYARCYARPRFSGLYRKLFLLIFWGDALRILLQLFGVADLAETQYITVLPSLLLIFVVLWEMTEKGRYAPSPYFFITVIGTVVLVLSIILELAAYVFYLYRGLLHCGTLFSVGLLFYMICMILSTLLHWVSAQHRVAALERELTNQKITMMAGQMRPHFLSNTLVAIQELCYTDPEQAADAIVVFSDYLRSNIDFLGVREPIPFEKEYGYICAYMKIEKIRFGDALVFATEIETMDFSVPALTIQPLVENAVRHGIRRGCGRGTVFLRVRQRDGKIRLSVKDDGVGFDASAVEVRSLGNVEMRLEELGAEMSIWSQPGKGTEVTIVLESVI